MMRLQGCSRTGDGLCPLDDFVAMAKRAAPAISEIHTACQARAGGGEVKDHSPEVCKDVLLNDVQGWGHGRHTGELWQKPK